MKEIVRTIYVPDNVARKIVRYLEQEPLYECMCLGEDETIVYTASFPNGYEMDVKCCGVQFDETAESNLAYAEAVLFHNGAEVCHTDPDDCFFGEWRLEADGTEYVTNVEVKR